MKKQKKMWQQPELIVLVRSRPEEAVLALCKGGDFFMDSHVQNGNCLQDLGAVCGVGCQDVAAS